MHVCVRLCADSSVHLCVYICMGTHMHLISVGVCVYSSPVLFVVGSSCV